jgi:DNA polymerase-3 subunit gamma/tau
MSYIALYRQWRPTRFEDVVEQEHVVKTLRYSVDTQRVAHAYLFCGTRGTGKTTMAHILSRAVNCLNPSKGEPCNECEICHEILDGSCVDVLEIDAASNNSVDNVRSIRDEVMYTPTKAKRKVYIIDEVHMLSTGAFNALLKTLEEPPEHVMFILATTEPHKLPATILSRCQRFDFRRISHDSIVKQLIRIASSGDIALSENAAGLIARMSDGAMRDAISLLDQCISIGSKSIEYDDILSVVGIVNDAFMTDFTSAMLDKRVAAILENVSKLVADGRDIAHFVSDLVLYYRNLLICKSTKGNCANLIEVPTEVLETLKAQSSKISLDEIAYQVKELSALEYNLKWATNQRVLLEVTLIKLCGSANSYDPSIEDRLTALEERLQSGSFPICSSSVSSASGFYDPNPLAPAANTADSIDLVYKDKATNLPTIDATDTADAGGADGASEASTDNVADADGADGASEASTDNAADADGVDGASEASTDNAPGMVEAAPAGTPEYEPWPNIMSHLRGMGKMTIYSYLINVKPIQPDENTIGLVIKESPIRSKISMLEHIRIIEEAALKVTGRQMKIKILDEDVIAGSSSKAKPSKNSEVLKKARSIAEKAGLPLEIIDD